MELSERAQFVVRGYAKIRDNDERKAIKAAIAKIDQTPGNWDDEETVANALTENLGTRIKAARLGPTSTTCTCCGR